jgi:hypothetical protein
MNRPFSHRDTSDTDPPTCLPVTYILELPLVALVAAMAPPLAKVSESGRMSLLDCV